MATDPVPETPAAGASYADVLTRLSTVSTRMTDILRTLGIGTVVFCWGFFTADKGIAHNVATHHRLWVVVTAATAVVGILCDLLHAVASYWVANRLRHQMEEQNQGRAPYPYNDLLYRSQTFFFAAKAFLMPLATASIIVLLFVMVLGPQPSEVPAPTACCCPGVTITPQPGGGPVKE